jgi:DNA processing protein
MYEIKTRVLLTLFRIKGIGKKFLCTFLDLVQKEKEESFSWEDNDSILRLMKCIRTSSGYRNLAKEDLLQAMEEIDSYLDYCMHLDIQIVPIWSELYPCRMRLWPVAPIFIFVRGNIDIVQEKKTVAMIGARSASGFSIRIAHRLAQRFVEQDFVVVSGLARGCDTAAHVGCMKSQGKTIAVLAHGLAMEVYPKANLSLSEQIVDEGGLLISEYDIFSAHHKGSFLARNRIQVLLSDGLVVIEGAQKGGTAYTVEYARKLGVPVGYFWSTERWWRHQRASSINQLLKDNGRGLMIDSMDSLEGFIGSLH